MNEICERDLNARNFNYLSLDEKFSALNFTIILRMKTLRKLEQNERLKIIFLILFEYFSN